MYLKWAPGINSSLGFILPKDRGILFTFASQRPQDLRFAVHGVELHDNISPFLSQFGKGAHNFIIRCYLGSSTAFPEKDPPESGIVYFLFSMYLSKSVYFITSLWNLIGTPKFRLERASASKTARVQDSKGRLGRI